MTTKRLRKEFDPLLRTAKQAGAARVRLFNAKRLQLPRKQIQAIRVEVQEATRKFAAAMAAHQRETVTSLKRSLCTAETLVRYWEKLATRRTGC
jgi:hypothetical protein